MQRSQGFAGIQAASLLGVSADSSAFTPHRAFTGSTPDGTRAYEQHGTLQKPVNFAPQVQDELIQDIQKACFLQGTLIADYFQRSMNYGSGTIAPPLFENALRALDLHYNWDPYFQQYCLRLFNEIDKSFHNGQPWGQVTHQDIDQFVHHVAKKKIEDIHRDMVYDIHQKLELRRGQTISIDMAFKQRENNRSFNTVTTGDVQMVLQQLGIEMKQLDVKFLCSKYIQANLQDQVHYQKFLDDLKYSNQLFGGGIKPKFSVGINSAAAGGSSLQQVCEAIVKKLYVLRLDFNTAMAQWCPSLYMTDMQFHQIFGERLQLVPTYATAADLKQVFQQLSLGQQTVGSNDVWRFITTQAPKSVNEMQADLLKSLSEKVADVRSIFDRDQHFQQGRGQMSFHAFTALLTSQLFLHQLNADFLATFYIGFQNQVDAERFLQDHQKHGAFIRPGGNFDPYQNNQFQNNNQYQNNNQFNQGPYGGQGYNNQLEPTLGFGLQTQNQNEFFKAIITKIVNEVNARGIQLALLFGQFQSRTSGPYINKMDFHSVLRNQVVQLDFNEFDVLEKMYAHPDYQQQDQINLTKFLEDVKQSQLASQNSQMLNQLTDKQRKDYKVLTDALAKGGVLTYLVLYLKMKDANDSGYLSQKNIQDAVNETLKKKSATSKQLTPTQIKDFLVGAVSQNSHGFFSYKEFIQHVIGVEKGQQLYLLDVRQLNQEAERERTHGTAAASGFIKPTGINNPENTMLGNIGAKILFNTGQNGANYEEIIKIKLGANAQDMNLDETALYSVLQELRIQLTADEQIAHQAWFQQRRGPTNRVAADAWLKALGLPCQTIKVVKAASQAKKKLLTEEQLRTCQAFLAEIAKELLRGTGGAGLRKLENYRDPNALVLKPSVFKKMLQRELSAPLMKRLTDDHIKNMVHYLVREEPGMVSFDKMYAALQLPQGKPPLPQEGVAELKEYTSKVQNQIQEAQVAPVVLHLLVWIQSNNLTLTQLFMVQPKQLKGTIPVTEFWSKLDKAGYTSKDRDGLVDALDNDRKRAVISLAKLNEAQLLFSKDAGGSQVDAKRKYGNLDQVIKIKIEKISQHLKANNYTTAGLHDMLDTNKDGFVDKMEFMVGFEQYFPNIGLSKRDYTQIFDAIDIDDNGFLSVNEFCLFIEGASLTRDQRISQIPQEMLAEINLEIDAFFGQFDINKDGELEAHEILTTMRGLGYTTITMEKAEEMIATVAAPGAKVIGQLQFRELMLPVMLDMLLAAEDNVEEYRDMFRQADTDYSGYLSADEIYAVLLQNGVDVSMAELVELMQEFDMDGNAQLEIDEFVAMMSLGDNLSFARSGATNTYLKIRKARKLNVMDFMKAFSNLPAAFTPSTSTERWKQRKNLPSGVLKPQVDPRTMLWKDMYPVISEMLTPEMQKPDNKPQFRPMETKLGIEITLESAEGIILPKNSDTFKRADVLKRAVRVGIFDDVKQEYVANIIQVPAEWTGSAGKEGNWRFNLKKDIGLNPVLFRQSVFEIADPQQHSLVFEFVIYLQNGVGAKQKVTELSCGFAKLKVEMAARDLNKYKVPVEGGSPMAVEKIKKEDLKGVEKKGVLGGLFGGGTTSSVLLVSTRQHAALEEDTKLHLSMLPGLCLVHQRMIHFVSGFRNYSAQKLLKEVVSGEFKQPGGNVAIATFPAVYDNPEIMEALVRVWTEDVVKGWQTDKKKSVRLCMTMAETYLSKLYPVLFSYDFDIGHGTSTTDSAIGNKTQYTLRKELIESALRYDPAKKGAKAVKQPLEELTQFKPFNVREIQFEVWDTRAAMQEHIVQKFDSVGVLNAAGGYSARPSQTNMNQFLQGTAPLQTGYDPARYQQANNIPQQQLLGGQLASPQVPGLNPLQSAATPAFNQPLNTYDSGSNSNRNALLQPKPSPRGNPTISVSDLDRRTASNLDPPNNTGYIAAIGDTPSFQLTDVQAAPNASKAINALGGQQQAANAIAQPGVQQQQLAGQQAARSGVQNQVQQPANSSSFANQPFIQPGEIHTGHAPPSQGIPDPKAMVKPMTPPHLVNLPNSTGSPGTLPQTTPITVSVSKTSTTGQGAGGAQAATNAGAGRGSAAAQSLGPSTNIPSANQATKSAVSPRNNKGLKVNVNLNKKQF